MTVSVFVGVSVDGFLARPNDTFDFLPDDCEPHGFEELLASVDAVVMGRRTFDVVLAMAEWPYGDKRVIVLSSRPLAATPAGAAVARMEGSPAEIVARLESDGLRHIYLDGGLTIQAFLRAGLVDRLTVTRVPVLIGAGIPLFGAIPRDIQLDHVATRSYPSGLVKSEYRVVSRPAS